jgi:hypothetical protein
LFFLFLTIKSICWLTIIPQLNLRWLSAFSISTYREFVNKTDSNIIVLREFTIWNRKITQYRPSTNIISTHRILSITCCYWLIRK